MGIVIAVAALCASLAPAASAADSVYWTNGSAGKGISLAALGGTGGADLPINAATLSTPRGVAINPATNKIYWANTNNTIGFANLDGSGAAILSTTGATLSTPRGVAINPATNKIYWTNTGNNTVSFANLDNTGGGGQLNTTGATLSSPYGPAVDPAGNKIYWVNAGGGGSVSFANLDNTGGGGKLPIGAGFFGAPEGMAIDKTAGKIYWANAASIGFSNLDGSSPGLLNTTGAPVAGPVGVAVDPAAGLVYWGNPGGAGTVGFAKTDNTGGGGAVVTTGATTTSLTFPALLKTPIGTGAPALTATGSAPGSTLSCTQGTWADNLLGSFLFQAPNSFAFQWLNGGVPVPGATSNAFVPSAVGSYGCRVTATNGAGSASQTSTTSATVFKLGKVTRNKKKGTAKLAVEVPAAGILTLTGKGIVKRSTASAAAGTVKLAVTAKGKKKKSLNKKGKLKSKLTIGFTPTGGTAAPNQTKKLTLRKKLQH